MHNILLQIIEKKQKDLEQQRRIFPFAQLKRNVSTVKSESNFISKLQNLNHSDIAIIAEIKLASPTISSLGSEKDILHRASVYEKAGTDAISFITESHYFKGNPVFIPKLKAKVNIPILQKDFVIDPYQIYEAKALGSDAILLIARLVDKNMLKDFVALSKKIGIEPVVEINDEEDLKKALFAHTSCIAVNARDLRTFKVNISKACRLLKKIPKKFIKLGFSGIKSSEEVIKYKKAGVKGILIGTSLMKATNIDSFIKNLRNINNTKVKICGIKTLEVAQVAIDSGADYLGFNFISTSKRYIDPKDAKKIIEKVRDKIKIVGVFQDADIKKVKNIAKDLHLDYIQLHGQEDIDYLKKLHLPVIKTIHSATKINDLPASYFLLDRMQQGKGNMVNVKIAKQISVKYPLFLAGGLTPENVTNRVKKIKPFAVDVANGVETNSIKDIKKIKDFIKHAKGVCI